MYMHSGAGFFFENLSFICCIHPSLSSDAGATMLHDTDGIRQVISSI